MGIRRWLLSWRTKRCKGGGREGGGDGGVFVPLRASRWSPAPPFPPPMCAPGWWARWARSRGGWAAAIGSSGGRGRTANAPPPREGSRPSCVRPGLEKGSGGGGGERGCPPVGAPVLGRSSGWDDERRRRRQRHLCHPLSVAVARAQQTGDGTIPKLFPLISAPRAAGAPRTRALQRWCSCAVGVEGVPKWGLGGREERTPRPVPACMLITAHWSVPLPSPPCGRVPPPRTESGDDACAARVGQARRTKDIEALP